MQRVHFDKVIVAEHRVEMGGCGIPSDGSYPLSISSEVVQRHVRSLKGKGTGRRSPFHAGFVPSVRTYSTMRCDFHCVQGIAYMRS